ncbi:MAG TPA: M48 family metalloprotease [Alphaproteobacteria bacterium]|nr:M48 family metalloprotease [Alphaproteobacteria bacterium]
MLKRTLLSILMLSLAVLGVPLPAAAQGGPQQLSLIRDSEIENTIRFYVTPIFRYAGLDPDNVEIHLVNDRRLNAFVANGQHIFINTGLLIASQNALQVIGVIAHETGHIHGGHLVRARDAIRNAQIQSLIALALGMGAAVAARDGGAAVATLGLGSKIVEGTYLKYSRTQEQSADQFALTALDAERMSARGLLEFFQILENQEFLVTDRQDPYMRTHPLTQDRIEFVRNHVESSPYKDAKLPAIYDEVHQRMRAKLIGFIEAPSRTFQVYPLTDHSIPARYARAIAYHKAASTDKALAEVDSLIAERPKDPYFHELKGQILFEVGRPAESVVSYEKAVQLLPHDALIRTNLGQSLVALDTPQTDQKAIANLNEASRRDPDYPPTWRLLGIAYGRRGDMGMASLSLAENALRIGDIKSARAQAARAERLLPKGSPGWNRVQDIKSELERQRSDGGRVD